jgi:hypothetical protein
MAELASGSEQSRSRPSLTEWLFNPFQYLAGVPALLLGLVAILLTGLLGSFSNSHFDGTLDFHTGAVFPLRVFLLEGIVDWLALAVVLTVVGKVASRTAFRAIDLLGTQAMARWPTLLIALAALLPGYQRAALTLAQQLMTNPGAMPHFAPADLPAFGLVMVVMLVALVWMVALMYRSYSLCCNVRGVKGAATFVIGLLAAEVVSKLVFLTVVIR